MTDKDQPLDKMLALQITNSVQIVDYDLIKGEVPFVWLSVKNNPQASKIIDKWAAEPDTEFTWLWGFYHATEPYYAFFHIRDDYKNALQIVFSFEHHQPLLDAIFTTGDFVFSKFLLRRTGDKKTVVSPKNTVFLEKVGSKTTGEYWNLRAKSPDYSKASEKWLEAAKNEDRA